MKHSLMVLTTSLLTFGTAYPALSASIFSESIDVGDQVSSAQMIGMFNSGDTLSGSLTDDASNADLFSINLTAGTSFTATVSNPFFNTQLFLFDTSGQGLTGNDDSDAVKLNAVFTYTPTTTGTYYLGVSGYNFDPVDSADNFIFSDAATGNFSITSMSSLAGWAKRDLFDFDPVIGNYEITLSRSALSLSEVSAVPEPSVLPGLLGLAGGLGLAIFKRKQLA